MNKVIEIKNVCKSYATFTLKDLSFDIPKGYVMGFIGPNGAGKTTTIKLILNMAKKDSGSISLFGSGGKELKNEEIGVVMDTPSYVPDWKVLDVEEALSPFYANWNGSSFGKYLKDFGIDGEKKIKDLSRGMKVKLQIAVALSHNARLLILDEPTSGLDPVSRDEIIDLLRDFVMDEENSVFFSTHITSDLEKIADYITLIIAGELAFTGQKDDLLGKYLRIGGGITDISGEEQKLVIGYRQHSTGFEGMIEAADAAKFSSKVLTEKVNLDEIIIFLTKETMSHE